MSNIKAQLHVESIPLYSIRLIESLRVFDVIQENVSEPKPFLSLGNMSSFLGKFFSPQLEIKAPKLMQQLNREGLQNSDRFAAGLVNSLKHVQLTNEQSLVQFYNKIKEVLCLTYQKPLEHYERWDIDDNMTPQMLNDRQNNIRNFYTQIHSFIEGMELFMFQSYLERINYCLSVISISNIQTEIFKVYKTFINPTVLNHISDFLVTIGQLQVNPQRLNNDLLQSVLSQKQNVVSYFGLISHFYSACKYRELKERLESTPCLFYHETFKTIIQALTIPDVKIQLQVAICLCMMSKYLQVFNDWILSDIMNNLMPVLSAVSNLKDEQTTYFTLICLKNITKRYQKKADFLKEDKNTMQMLQKIHIFSLYVLGIYNNIDLQKQCFLLVAEVLKVCPVNYKQIEELKVTTKVFEIQIDYQAILVPAVLAILEASIHRKIYEIANMIINDPAFLACLQTHFGVKESIFFYQFLHVVYLLSYTHTNFLFEKNLLTKTLDMMFEDTNPTVSSICSDILLNTVQQGLQNEQILEILYDKLLIFDRVMPFLFKKCFAKSDYLNLLLIQNNIVPQYTYFDKYILNNFFKILYSLAVGVNRKHSKYAFLKKVNEEIINSTSKILDDLFNSGNRDLIEIVLREKVKINSKKLKIENGIPLFKVINNILDEMTYNLQNRSLSILKTINRQVKSFGQNLLKSQVFTLHELEIEAIPLYIRIEIEYDNQRFVRQISHKFQLATLKTFIKKLVAKGIDRNISDVRDVILKYKENGRIIENEVQYKTLVSKALQNRVTVFAWEVHDIKWRHRREEPMVSSFIVPNYDPGMRSYREPNAFTTSRAPINQSRNVPNFGTNRMNNTMRQNLGDNEARRTFSPINFNYTYDRARSPQFGGSGGNRNR